MIESSIYSVFPIEEVGSGSGTHPAIIAVETDFFHTGNLSFHTGNLSEPGNFQETLAITI